MYDIFFAIYDSDVLKNQIKSRFPLAKFCTVDKNNKTYDVLLDAQRRSLTKMFWFVSLDQEILDDFSFDFKVSEYDQNYVHIFKDSDVFLIPKAHKISQQEIEHLLFVNSKEVDVAAAKHMQFDIVFISYTEPNADENYQNLIKKFPNAKRVHGIKGIHQAHKKAAELVETPMFWVVDGDAHVLDTFNFDYKVSRRNFDTVYVCKSINPINGLEYGYGGVKLLPTDLTKNLDVSTVDMTTSISSKFLPLHIVSNISKFNTDEFNTWKSAFRECAKLSSKLIVGQNDEETLKRLDIWCTEGKEQPFGEFAIQGAIQGKEFGLRHKGDISMLSKINDWKWLEKEFKDI